MAACIKEPVLGDAIRLRNSLWKNNNYIPSWVDINDVGLDQFYTELDVAKYCFESLISFLQKENVKIEDLTFIEPSAGNGSFYNLLPKDRRIGIDIAPQHREVIQQDFLSWKPKKKLSKYIFYPYRGTDKLKSYSP